MKNSWTVGVNLPFALCMAVIVCSTALGEDPTSKKRDGENISKLDKVTTGTNVRASQLIGMNIQNERGEGVGEVNDIVLDAGTGTIRYMAVTYGGFLGLGNKMFAVPYEAFKCHQDPNDRDETILVLNVTQQQLEGAVGFNEDQWPNFADTKFTSELDKRYGVERNRRLRNRDVDVRVDQNGVKVDVDANRDKE
ncbi:MAG: PRC-barrel domain-containing protein [Planctomycetota bacterium]